MKYTLTLLLLFSLSGVFAQPVTFQKVYGDSIGTFQFRVHQTSDGGYFCGNDLGRVLKIDSMGNLQWMKTITSPPNFIEDGYWEIAKENDGGYYLTGRMRLVRLDSNYTIKWLKEIVYDSTNSSSMFLVTSMYKTPDNCLILQKNGGILSLDNGLIKMDTSGNVLWAKHYVLPAAPYFSFGMDHLALTPDGGFVATGAMLTAPTPFQYLHLIILKTDSLGNSQWCKRVFLPTGSSYAFNHITPTSDGGFVVAGERNTEGYLLKIDQSGNILWMKWYEFSNGLNSDARWVEELPDKSLIVAGDYVHVDSVSFGQTCFLMKTDSMGNLIWSRRLGGAAEVWTGCVKPTTDNGFAIGVRRGSFPSVGIGIIKTDSMGMTGGCLQGTPVVTVTNLNDSVVNMAVVDSAIVVTTAPTTYTVTTTGFEINLCSGTGISHNNYSESSFSIYPNPVYNFLNVTYNVEKVNARFVISDITGRVLKEEKISQSTAPGIDVSKLPVGLYFYTATELIGNKKIQTGKFVKL